MLALVSDATTSMASDMLRNRLAIPLDACKMPIGGPALLQCCTKCLALRRTADLQIFAFDFEGARSDSWSSRELVDENTAARHKGYATPCATQSR
eukprot:scaffold8168_cov239-Pinguiococcus_pyrenoidosus.AAC.3